MTKCDRKILVLVAVICFFLTGATGSSLASEIKPTALTGMQYTIFLYNLEIGVTNISFEENLSLMLEAYNGFGLYLPLGTMFTGFYWAPNVLDERDRLLLLNGVVLADFIAGWGIDMNTSNLFFFLGYEAL